MTSPIIALTELAEFIYDTYETARVSGQVPQQYPGMWQSQSFANQVEGIVYAARPDGDLFKAAIDILAAEPDLAPFKPVAGELDPMIYHFRGGVRTSFQEVVVSLFTSAATRIYYLRMEVSKPSFIRAVLENFEEMLRAGKGEPIRVYDIVGYAGIRIEDSVQVQTPWGVLRAAPPDIATRAFGMASGFHSATAILSTPRLVPIKVSRGPSLEPFGIDAPFQLYVEQTRQLLPLAFALSTIGGDRCVPMVMFESAILPMMNLNSFSLPGMFLPPQPIIAPNDAQLDQAAEWCRRLAQDHDDNLQVAERRGHGSKAG